MDHPKTFSLMSSTYLDRYAWPSPIFDAKEIKSEPGLIVVLPAYNEPDILSSIQSLQSCSPPSCQVLILVIFNEAENEDQVISRINEKGFLELQKFNGPYQTLAKHLKLPSKKAGVGLARKIGMDEAVRIFNRIGQKDGIITCFDADCTCDEQFLIAIEKNFNDHPTKTALTFFEHPLEGEHPEAIINYEIYLRYYVNALRWSGFPYAFQTLGSCISVRADAYSQQGGMNTRKAGEDFYFIHKMTALGAISEINATTIYPSDRLSARVPFGTGHAIGKYLNQRNPDYPVYAPDIFKDLRQLVNLLPKLYEDLGEVASLPEAITSFLHTQDFDRKINEILDQTNSYESFYKRYFNWMDGLKVLKLVHHCRDNFYPNVPVESAISWLNNNYFQEALKYQSKKEALIAIRSYDRNHPFHTK